MWFNLSDTIEGKARTDIFGIGSEPHSRVAQIRERDAKTGSKDTVTEGEMNMIEKSLRALGYMDWQDGP